MPPRPRRLQPGQSATTYSAIGYDLQHPAELARAAADAVTVVLLVLCI
jgi:hypothetical protein